MNIPIITGLRQPPPEWVARLREIDPIRDAVSYLEFVWYEPAERWVLYEMVPAYDIDVNGVKEPTVPLAILEELKGTDPDLIPWTAPLVSHRQWLLFQKTGRWARPSWIIQGTKGGHYASYDKATVELCKLMQRPCEPPKAGDLPYAPFDERTVTGILRMNKMLATQNNLDAFRREHSGEGAKRTFRESLKAARAEYVKFLDDQMEEAAEHFVDAYRAGEYDKAPVSDVDWTKKDEQETDTFIETGNFTRPTD